MQATGDFTLISAEQRNGFIASCVCPDTPRAAADHHSSDAIDPPSSSRSSQHRRGTGKRIHRIVCLPRHAQSSSRSSQQRRSRLVTGDSTLSSWNKETASSHRASARATPKDAITSTSDESYGVATPSNIITTVCKVSCFFDHTIVSSLYPH